MLLIYGHLVIHLPWISEFSETIYGEPEKKKLSAAALHTRILVGSVPMLSLCLLMAVPALEMRPKAKSDSHDLL